MPDGVRADIEDPGRVIRAFPAVDQHRLDRVIEIGDAAQIDTARRVRRQGGAGDAREALVDAEVLVEAGVVAGRPKAHAGEVGRGRVGPPVDAAAARDGLLFGLRLGLLFGLGLFRLLFGLRLFLDLGGLLFGLLLDLCRGGVVIVVIIATAHQGEASGAHPRATARAQHRATAKAVGPHPVPVVALQDSPPLRMAGLDAPVGIGPRTRRVARDPTQDAGRVALTTRSVLTAPLAGEWTFVAQTGRLLWRLRYKLSFRDVTELLLQRGSPVMHETIRDWEFRFAPLLPDRLRAKRAAARASPGTSMRPT